MSSSTLPILPVKTSATSKQIREIGAKFVTMGQCSKSNRNVPQNSDTLSPPALYCEVDLQISAPPSSRKPLSTLPSSVSQKASSSSPTIYQRSSIFLVESSKEELLESDNNRCTSASLSGLNRSTARSLLPPVHSFHISTLPKKQQQTTTTTTTTTTTETSLLVTDLVVPSISPLSTSTSYFDSEKAFGIDAEIFKNVNNRQHISLVPVVVSKSFDQARKRQIRQLCAVDFEEPSKKG
jgi:hypothetical protein